MTTDVNIKPGAFTIPMKISVPGAKLLDLEVPNLYLCERKESWKRAS